MSHVIEKTTATSVTGATPTRMKIADCDIHPAVYTADDLIPFMSKRWAEYLKTFGGHIPQPYTSTTPYPRSAPLLSRRDAWPDKGGPPGSDLPFMQKQHLDPYNIDLGLLQVLSYSASSQRNQEFGAEMAHALNEWQLAFWCDPEPRLRGSIVVCQEYPEAAIAEIEKRAGDKRFAQINITPRAQEPLGRRRYWDVYRAAEATNRPVGIHVGGYGGHAPTGGGWPTFYAEEHHSQAITMQAQMTSMVLEGVFEHFPKLKIVFIEGGFAWVPALKWRLDQHFARFRDEVPHLKRLPSEYIKDHFWFTTQPIEEPERKDDMRFILDEIGIDRLMYSSDYPHWDFDDPQYVFKIPLSAAERQAIFHDNAHKLYEV